MPTRKPIILCVDDEQPNLKLLQNILGPRGFDVVIATNGREALAKIKSQVVDLVLLDVMMPEMDGFEVCRAIKEDEKSRNIPVIMITALTMKRNRIEGIEAGAEEFLAKPFDQTEVLARIAMLLKVKGLNDKLNCAYENITSLTNFGENLINTFTSLEFDFMAKIDAIVGQVLRQKNDPIDKPKIVLVRIASDTSDCEWFHYEFTCGRMERTPLRITMEISLPEEADSRSRFYSEETMASPMFTDFTNNLMHYSINPKNMVCYLGDKLSVFALNYDREVTPYDVAVLNSVVMQTLFLRSLSLQVKETEDAFEYTVKSLARASEVNDDDTGKHIVRVGLYCALLAQKLKMPEAFVQALRIQALLHDVGKIHTPSAILRKSGPLTPEEWKVMRQHPAQGGKIIGDHPRLAIGCSIAISHHERWDGSGYPHGLAGERIPLAGRIMNIADQYDALRNARIYKPGMDHKTVIRIITEGDGRTMPSHFDPRVFAAFKDSTADFEEVYERLKG